MRFSTRRRWIVRASNRYRSASPGAERNSIGRELTLMSVLASLRLEAGERSMDGCLTSDRVDSTLALSRGRDSNIACRWAMLICREACALSVRGAWQGE